MPFLLQLHRHPAGALFQGFKRSSLSSEDNNINKVSDYNATGSTWQVVQLSTWWSAVADSLSLSLSLSLSRPGACQLWVLWEWLLDVCLHLSRSIVPLAASHSGELIASYLWLFLLWSSPPRPSTFGSAGQHAAMRTWFCLARDPRQLGRHTNIRAYITATFQLVLGCGWVNIIDMEIAENQLDKCVAALYIMTSCWSKCVNRDEIYIY